MLTEKKEWIDEYDKFNKELEEKPDKENFCVNKMI